MYNCCAITSQDDKEDDMSRLKQFCAFQTLLSAEVVRGHRVAAPASSLTAACQYVHLQSASSCHAMNCSTRLACETGLLFQKVQSHSCAHQAQPLQMETKTPESCRHKLAGQNKQDICCHALRANMAVLSSGVAALLDSVSTSSAPACCCQGKYLLDRTPWHHCARSPTQPVGQAGLERKWVAAG